MSIWREGEFSGRKEGVEEERGRTISSSAGSARPDSPACFDRILRATGS